MSAHSAGPTATPDSSTPPGNYSDPQTGRQRYWNGLQWGEGDSSPRTTSEVPAGQPLGGAPSSGAYNQYGYPGSRGKAILWGLLAAAFGLATLFGGLLFLVGVWALFDGDYQGGTVVVGALTLSSGRLTSWAWEHAYDEW